MSRDLQKSLKCDPWFYSRVETDYEFHLSINLSRGNWSVHNHNGHSFSNNFLIKTELLNNIRGQGFL